MQAGLSTLDCIIVVVYLAAMLGMGLWIARRQRSTDDFFVGGRNLPPWAVGISIFASLLSTITYLGMPGEMFRTGVAFLTRQIPIPLVLLVVCCLLIPFFMRLKLTSAYEYLEQRYNYTIRALAAAFCILLLFGWISVVVLTASRAMAEITQLDLKWFFGSNTAATKTAPDGTALISPEDLTGEWGGILDQLSDSPWLPPLDGFNEYEDQHRRLLQLFDDVQSPQGLDPRSEELARAIFANKLTSLLSERSLYFPRQWHQVNLNDEAKSYIAAGHHNLTDRELTHFHRALLQSAYSNVIKPSRGAHRDADMHFIILAIGMFSVVYTTLGGIRAVIWTDVIQFFVLMLGAFFTMGAIAYMTDSGIGDWLAVAQEYKHEEVRWFDWDPRTRSTVFTISLGMFFWFVCTHGANQVALQRYFSVKDVRAARQSYVVSALASIFIGVILAGVGIALLYYIQQPGVLVSDLPAKAGIESAVSSIRNEAQDAVFPQFIGRLIPSGLRGLVVAALFAAAMSTIDSGANSVSTILTVDFFRRLKPEWTSESGELFRARLFTASMGVIVVGYTVLIYHISKGTDIISLCQKGFNCFLGPLGALFFMGMLYKRATPATMLPAFLIGEVVGVLTSFSTDLFDIPFSTHLVIPASCLLTCLICVVFAEATRSLARPDQLQMMWKPIVKSSKTAPLD